MLTGFKSSLYDINNAIEGYDLIERPLVEIVPEQYHEFLPLLSTVLADRIPPHRPGIDYEVRLKDGETPTREPFYSMLGAELVVLKEWLKRNMSKGFIRQSSSPFAAPVIFSNKLDGGLRFSIDYRYVNNKTIKNQYPLQVI
jgi:hypothetical protein